MNRKKNAVAVVVVVVAVVVAVVVVAAGGTVAVIAARTRLSHGDAARVVARKLTGQCSVDADLARLCDWWTEAAPHLGGAGHDCLAAPTDNLCNNDVIQMFQAVASMGAEEKAPHAPTTRLPSRKSSWRTTSTVRSAATSSADALSAVDVVTIEGSP